MREIFFVNEISFTILLKYQLQPLELTQRIQRTLKPYFTLATLKNMSLL